VSEYKVSFISDYASLSKNSRMRNRMRMRMRRRPSLQSYNPIFL